MAEAAMTARAEPLPGSRTGPEPGAGRQRAKRMLDAIAYVVVLPLLLTYRLSIRLLPGRREMIFQSYSQSLSLRSGTIGIFLRRAFYRRTLTRCGRDCTIGFGTTFATPEVEIGENVTISTFSIIGHVSIGDDSLIGSNVHILSGKHQHYFDRLDVPIRYQGGRFTRLRIGRDVWIGNQVVVLADVGDQAVVAAGSVISKPIPPRALVGGNPARILGERGAAQRVARDAGIVR